MGTGDRFICETGLSIAVNQSKTGPPSTRFGFLCMHRVPGGVIKLSAPRWPHNVCQAISKSLKSGTLPTFTMLRSLLRVEKVARELVYIGTFQFRQVQLRIPLRSFISKKCH